MFKIIFQPVAGNQAKRKRGPAIVRSQLPEIGVSVRLYYTSGDSDEQLLAISDSKVVVFGQGNHGD